VTLVDTRVLLDVLVEGAAHGDESEERLAGALRRGPVLVNDVIAAELAPLFDRDEDLWRTLASAQIRLAPYPRDAIYAAGQGFLHYRRSGGKRQRILPDFLIGAHALVGGASLLTRDRGFYGSHFPKLRLVG
jgi:predicted nucleic acid-binding protein